MTLLTTSVTWPETLNKVTCTRYEVGPDKTVGASHTMRRPLDVAVTFRPWGGTSGSEQGKKTETLQCAVLRSFSLNTKKTHYTSTTQAQIFSVKFLLPARVLA